MSAVSFVNQLHFFISINLYLSLTPIKSSLIKITGFFMPLPSEIENFLRYAHPLVLLNIAWNIPPKGLENSYKKGEVPELVRAHAWYQLALREANTRQHIAAEFQNQATTLLMKKKERS